MGGVGRALFESGQNLHRSGEAVPTNHEENPPQQVGASLIKGVLTYLTDQKSGPEVRILYRPQASLVLMRRSRGTEVLVSNESNVTELIAQSTAVRQAISSD